MQVINAGPTLSFEMGRLLNFSFSVEEINGALWSINDNKALGLDGFNRKFYKVACLVIEDDIIDAIQSFYRTIKLVKSWNIITIILISEVPYSPVVGTLDLFHVLMYYITLSSNYIVLDRG